MITRIELIDSPRQRRQKLDAHFSNLNNKLLKCTVLLASAQDQTSSIESKYEIISTRTVFNSILNGLLKLSE